MADTELKDLTAATSVISTDLLYTVVDPAGTPLDRKINVGDLVTSIDGLIDHSNLAGLTTGDPHTQYVLLDGRSGGQSVFGGTTGPDVLRLRGSSAATYNPIIFNFDAMTVRHSVGIGGDPQSVTNLLQLFVGSEPSSMSSNSVGLYAKDFAPADARLYVFSEIASAGSAVIIGSGTVILAANSSGGSLYGSAAVVPTTLTLRANSDSGQGGFIDIGDSVRFISSVSPAQIAADQNNYNPGSSVTAVRLSSDASRNITGLNGGTDGRLLVVHNVGSNDIVLKHESASSSAGARFNLPGASDLSLRPGASVLLRFDGTSSRWRATSAAQWGDALVKAAQVQSTIATGTAPLIVASTTAVANLNADLLDGLHSTSFASASHSHAASDITSGTLATARGGLNADVSSVAKGGLIAGTGSGSFGLLAVGSDNQILTANSTQTAGLKWIETPLPTLYRYGMLWFRDAVDFNNDIAVYSGACRSSDDTENIRLTAEPLVKQLDANWAVGSNAGGLDTGSKAVNTWYWIWAIKRTDTGVCDVLLSASNSSPTMPANYDKRRLIGVVRTNGFGNLALLDTRWVLGGIYIRWLDPAGNGLDVSVTNQGTTRITYTLAYVPPFGSSLYASVYCDANVVIDHASALSIIYVASPDHVDSAPSLTAAPLATVSMAASGQETLHQVQLYADRNAQITVRASNANSTFRVQVLGFFWPGGV